MVGSVEREGQAMTGVCPNGCGQDAFICQNTCTRPNREGEHDFKKPLGYEWPFCLICGVVKRNDGKNTRCKGPSRLREMEP